MVRLLPGLKDWLRWAPWVVQSSFKSILAHSEDKFRQIWPRRRLEIRAPLLRRSINAFTSTGWRQDRTHRDMWNLHPRLFKVFWEIINFTKALAIIRTILPQFVAKIFDVRLLRRIKVLSKKDIDGKLIWVTDPTGIDFLENEKLLNLDSTFTSKARSMCALGNCA